MATAPDKKLKTPVSHTGGGEIFSNVTVKQSISSYGTPKRSDDA